MAIKINVVVLFWFNIILIIHVFLVNKAMVGNVNRSRAQWFKQPKRCSAIFDTSHPSICVYCQYCCLQSASLVKLLSDREPIVVLLVTVIDSHCLSPSMNLSHYTHVPEILSLDLWFPPHWCRRVSWWYPLLSPIRSHLPRMKRKGKRMRGWRKGRRSCEECLVVMTVPVDVLHTVHVQCR